MGVRVIGDERLEDRSLGDCAPPTSAARSPALRPVSYYTWRCSCSCPSTVAYRHALPPPLGAGCDGPWGRSMSTEGVEEERKAREGWG